MPASLIRTATVHDPKMENQQRCRILVVDDESSFCDAIRFSLADVQYGDVPIEVSSQPSAQAALAHLRTVEQDHYAIMLIDVVMENASAGLTLVKQIRDELHFANTRIILCTGQPGYAPPIDVVQNLDINDYRLKTNLTRDDIICTVLAAARTYYAIQRLEQHYQDLQHASSAIASVSNTGNSEAVAQEAASQLIAMQPVQSACIFVREIGSQPKLIASDVSDPTHLHELEALAQSALSGGQEASGKASYCFVAFYSTISIAFAIKGSGTDHLGAELIRTYALAFFASYVASHNAQHMMANKQLATVGRIASVISHEINTPLAYIESGLDQLNQLLKSLPEGQRQEALCATSSIVDASARLRDVVRNMLMLSRREAVPTEPVSVRKTIEEAIEVVRPRLRKDVSIKIDEGVPTTWVAATPSRLVQVLSNLLLNASEAFPPASANKEIRVSWAVELDWVSIHIEDTAAGIPKETLARIFEPFFTTKSSGTGIGLAICRALINNCGGDIDVSSEVGQGTIVTVRLLSCEPPVVQTSELPKNEHRLNVLILEDDSLIGRTFERFLSKHHCVIREECDQAIAALHEEEFDLIIADYHVHGETAKQFIGEALRLQSSLEGCIAIVSGAAESPAVRSLCEEFNLHLLSKPFRRSDLEELIDRMSAESAT